MADRKNTVGPLEHLEDRTMMDANLASGVLNINGTRLNDTINIGSPVAGTIEASTNGVRQTFNAAEVSSVVISGLGRNDRINIAGSTPPITVFVNGGTGHDVITADPNFAGILKAEGGVGNDTITGGSGDDVLHGDGGRDSLNGGAGNDAVFGDTSNDTLRGGAGQDQVIGGKGRDLFYGGRLDTDDFGRGDRRITTSDDDVVIPPTTPFTINGNVITPGQTPIGCLEIDTDPVTGQTIISDRGANSVRIQATDEVFANGFSCVDATEFNGNLRATGTEAHDVILGGHGNDILQGLGGNDRLEGNAGVDQLFGGDGSDTLVGGSEADTLTGGTGPDQFDNDQADVLPDFNALEGDTKNTFVPPSPFDGSVEKVGDVLVINAALLNPRIVGNEIRLLCGENNVVVLQASVRSGEAVTTETRNYEGVSTVRFDGTDLDETVLAQGLCQTIRLDADMKGGNDRVETSTGVVTVYEGLGSGFVTVNANNQTVDCGGDGALVDAQGTYVVNASADCVIVNPAGSTPNPDPDPDPDPNPDPNPEPLPNPNTEDFTITVNGDTLVLVATHDSVRARVFEDDAGYHLDVPGKPLVDIPGMFTKVSVTTKDGTNDVDLSGVREHVSTEMVGGTGKDLLQGGQGKNSIVGGAGDDTLIGNNKEDFLSGEAGNDDLYLGQGRDIGLGDAGYDKVFNTEDADNPNEDDHLQEVEEKNGLPI